MVAGFGRSGGGASYMLFFTEVELLECSEFAVDANDN